ncbi:MAG: EAL domain-containing protein [Burkholderiaceae bacterium]|nr:EAL domain-containing protein [Burkholderiaceae bacterium]
MTARRRFGLLPRRLSSRLMLSVVLLVATLQAIALGVVAVINQENARDRAREELVAGDFALSHALAHEARDLRQTTALLANDPLLRGGTPAALAQASAAAGLSPSHRLLLLEGERVLGVVDGAGQPLGPGASPAGADAPAAIAVAGACAAPRDDAPVYRVSGDAGYLIACAPIWHGAATLVGALRIDDVLAHHLHELTATGVTLVLRPLRAPAATVLGSSLPPAQSAALVAQLPSADERSTLRTLAGREIALRGRVLASAHEVELIAFTHRALSDVAPVFNRLQTVLLLLAVASLAVAALVGYLIATALTRPLHALTDSARRIRDGDYAEPIAVRGAAEIAVLADSLDHMREGIAAREAEVVRLAYTDGVTHLPNRAMLIQRLARTLADMPRALAVLRIRIERFTQISEALGHATGEDVLRHVAARLQHTADARATVARVADDEFAVALPGARADEARLAARAVLDALRDPLEHEVQPIDVAVSIGVALYPEHGDDVESLLHCSDVAVKAALRAHVSIAYYEPEHELVRREHLSLIGELRRAVAESQLRAFYQPKIDLATGRAVGAEALVRWRHPERGLLSPGHFMPFAEQTGYVRVLTRWMLAVTLRQCGLWAEAGTPLSVAVNISTRDLTWPELPAFIADLLRAHSVPPALVCLEITEGVFMDDPEYALSAMQALRALGLRLAIDDFGTGFSSLAYMKRMPVQELKLDAAFIKGMGSNAKATGCARWAATRRRATSSPGRCGARRWRAGCVIALRGRLSTMRARRHRDRCRADRLAVSDMP